MAFLGYDFATRTWMPRQQPQRKHRHTVAVPIVHATVDVATPGFATASDAESERSRSYGSPNDRSFGGGCGDEADSGSASTSPYGFGFDDGAALRAAATTALAVLNAAAAADVAAAALRCDDGIERTRRTSLERARDRAELGSSTVRYERTIGRFRLYVLVGTESGLTASLDARRLTAAGSLGAGPSRNRRVEIGPGQRHAGVGPSAASVAAAVRSAPLRPHDSCRGAAGVWHLLRIDQSPRQPLDSRYCAHGTGAGTHVYVVDTGVADHDDFRWAVRRDYDYFAADKHGRGDANGHGTHVAGLVASRTYGVAPDALVHSVAVLNGNGVGSLATLAEGLLWVLENGVNTNAASSGSVVQMSLGALDAYSSTVTHIIDRLRDERGYVVVASAGNSAVDACRSFPGGLDTVVTVAATDSYDRKAAFSNDGACVDVLAPGVDVRSLHRDGVSTVVYSGTSMAAPEVAGAVLLLMQRWPHATVTELTATLLAHATDDAVQASTMRTDTPNRLLHVLNSQVDGSVPPPLPHNGSVRVAVPLWIALLTFVWLLA